MAPAVGGVAFRRLAEMGWWILGVLSTLVLELSITYLMKLSELMSMRREYVVLTLLRQLQLSTVDI